MLTRLIGGNRVITLGTAIEEHFLVTQNWGMGSTIGVILIVAMFIVMLLTVRRRKGVANNAKEKSLNGLMCIYSLSRYCTQSFI